MSWFKRKAKGILTDTKDKKETPEGLWYKTPTGKIIDSSDLKDNLYVSPEDNYHVRIGSQEYFEILFDEAKFTEFASGLSASDPLKFEDTKKYADRLKESQKKSNLKDAMRTAFGKIEGEDLVIACMDFSFIGGSMGAVVGEKIARAVDKAIEKKCALLIISKSGGARMMEAGISLMQMAKTSAKLTIKRSQIALHFFNDRSNHRRSYRFFCYVRRFKYCRAKCINRLCRPKSN